MLTGANTATPSFTAPDVAGSTELQFTLTVTDERDASTSDQVSVFVNYINTAPTADAGADRSVAEGAAVTLDGSGSSDAETGISYQWVQINNGYVPLQVRHRARGHAVGPAAC